MLTSFKKKKSAKVSTQASKIGKAQAKKKQQAKAIKEELSDSSDSSDSDSDDQYEEILISNLKKYPLPKHPAEETIKPKEEPSVARELKVELPPKPQLKKEETANHSNHFQEEPPPTKPIDMARSLTGIATPSPIVKKKKHKSKKIVIKKYYQQREPKPTRSEKEEAKPKPKTNFLGFPISDVSENSRERNHITSRIFNW